MRVRTRVRLDLAYDGTDFSGWALQPGLRTVEGELTAALTRVLRLAEPPRLVVAGRTDAGVHARGQVAHVDLPAAALAEAPGRSGREPLPALGRSLSGVLPADLVVRQVGPAPAGFDARFAALQRRYSYQVATERSALDPLRRREVLVTRGPLDVAAMNDASARLLGLRDFAAFCRGVRGRAPCGPCSSYSWRPDPGQGLLTATVVADAFCHSMVRALVGAVLEVGRGRRGPGWPAELMAAAVRRPLGTRRTSARSVSGGGHLPRR